MQVSVSVPLQVSIGEAWEKLSDLEDHVNWMADAERIDFEGELRSGPGVTMHVLTRIGPFSTTDVIKVVEWEPPRLIRVDHTGLFTGHGAFHLAPMGDSATLFTWEEEILFPWYLGGPIGAGFAKPVLTLVWKRNLSRLRRSVEGR
ncbi:MAG: SRPBCC family protein [Acidimicrobiia bacterium]|nr:SRPBCC family protein [Acidimicrobiia bacterium]MBT8251077.1 SRPBCC family protein [Acidimicrobiia bacterium]NND13508.1 SRPBCC family protein [Acidimicrobiia bacterium]NNL29242.1 SRPBCC family protein [Acidimicrobiia bacterium]